MIALFGITAWIVFSIRDYWLLETFAGRRNTAAPAWYLASMLLVMAVIIAAWLAEPRMVGAILSRRYLAMALAAHAPLSAWPMWLVRSGKLYAASIMALAPAPAAWILLMLAATSIANGNSRAAAITAAWIAIASAVIVAGVASRLAAPVAFADDRAFPVRFAACSNCLAVCLIPMIGW